MNELEALVVIWQTSGETHTYLWSSYVVVALAVVGFCLTEVYSRVTTTARICLVILLLGVMSTNAWSIWDNLAVYNAAVSQLRALPAVTGSLKPVTESMREIGAGHLVILHAVLDVCVIAVVLSGGRARAAD